MVRISTSTPVGTYELFCNEDMAKGLVIEFGQSSGGRLESDRVRLTDYSYKLMETNRDELLAIQKKYNSELEIIANNFHKEVKKMMSDIQNDLSVVGAK